MDRLMVLVGLLFVAAGAMGQTVIYSSGFSPSDTVGWGALSEFTSDTTVTSGEQGWYINEGGTPTPMTGPDVPHQGTHYVYFEHSCGPSAMICPDSTSYSLVSPVITLAGTSSSLSFYYLLYGDAMSGTPSSLTVNVLSDGGATVTPIFSSANGIHTDGTLSNWTQETIDLSAFNGQQIRIEFLAVEGIGIESRGDIGIDSMEISLVPTPIPTLGEWGVLILLLLLMIVGAASMPYTIKKALFFSQIQGKNRSEDTF